MSSVDNIDVQPMNPPFNLSVVLQGSSGIEIRAVLSKNYDLREFTLNNNPQPVFISPWMQFEPTEMNDERARIAHEIVHRVTNYDALLKHITELKARIENFYDREERFRTQRDVTFDMWKADRKRMGLPEDFSDITDWPAEM